MALIVCQCGDQVDDQADFHYCGALAPGGAAAEVLQSDAPQLRCLSCGTVVLPRNGLLFSTEQILNLDNCAGCRRENPTTLCWWRDGSSRKDKWKKRLFRQVYWFWSICLWLAFWQMHQAASYPNQSSNLWVSFQETVVFLIWLVVAGMSGVFMLTSTLMVTRTHKPRTQLLKAIRWMLREGVAWLVNAFVYCLVWSLVFMIIVAAITSSFGRGTPKGDSGIFDILAGGLLPWPMMFLSAGLVLWFHFSLERYGPQIHLWMLKRREPFFYQFWKWYAKIQYFVE